MGPALLVSGVDGRLGGLIKRVGILEGLVCTAPGFLDTGLHYAARLKSVSSHAARASSGLR